MSAKLKEMKKVIQRLRDNTESELRIEMEYCQKKVAFLRDVFSQESAANGPDLSGEGMVGLSEILSEIESEFELMVHTVTVMEKNKIDSLIVQAKDVKRGS